MPLISQIINEPTRYNSKSVYTGILIDVILTNSPSKYTSAVFNQDLSDHCLIACIRNGSATKRPPLITVKWGGVAIYCRDSLQSSVILSRSMHKQFELLTEISPSLLPPVIDPLSSQLCPGHHHLHTFKSFSRRSYPERLTNWCIHLMTSSGTATLQ